MTKEFCIIIPALKKSAIIPDQLVKKIAGITLIQRSINIAKEVLSNEDIFVITDSQEIVLICQRNKINCEYNQTLRFSSCDIANELKFFLLEKKKFYQSFILFRPDTPLISSKGITDAYKMYKNKCADGLVTLKKEEHRLWEKSNGNSIETLLKDDSKSSVYIEIKALQILASSVLDQNGKLKIIPFFLNDRCIEITSYQDWWICEKLLKRKHIVFVVAGYTEIGMGHVYRALLLAHEISDHQITFLCTNKSDLAVKKIAEKDYKTFIQYGDLANDVLKLEPDMVINDFLTTDKEYILSLKRSNIKVVNFEDNGSGAEEADLVINAIYEQKKDNKNIYCGYKYFCLRDEFQNCKRSDFKESIKNVLITFGGTDHFNLAHKTIEAIYKICKNNNIQINIVAGPGYAHKKSFKKYITSLEYKKIYFTDSTNIISSFMEQADIAITSAGRTVYELAHIRVPSLVLAQHEREDMHTFARPENGFEYLGIMQNYDKLKVQKGLHQLLNFDYRKKLYARMDIFDFSGNKAKVLKKILSLLK